MRWLLGLGKGGAGSVDLRGNVDLVNNLIS